MPDSPSPNEIGTLIVVVLKAKNLPNKRHIGKQDPFCSLELNGERRRTRAVKRGGQHPEWDDEVRFKLVEDDTLDPNKPPSPPPKEGTPSKSKPKNRKIKGGKTLRLMCYADDPREPELIGETAVELEEALTTGETDEWFTLTNKGKYCGEVYLELTFWSNEEPPPVNNTPKQSVMNPQYGGPGSFTPSPSHPPRMGSEDSLPPSSYSGLPSAHSQHMPHRRESVPAALKSSNSLAKVTLYDPGYQRTDSIASHGSQQTMNSYPTMDEFGTRRRESFPPLHGTHGGRPISTASFTGRDSFSSQSSHGFNHTPDLTESLSRMSVREESASPPHHGFQRDSFSAPPESFDHHSDYQAHYNDGYDYGQASGFQTPNGMHNGYPIPQHSSFVGIPSQAPTPVPGGYMSSATPVPSAYEQMQQSNFPISMSHMQPMPSYPTPSFPNYPPPPPASVPPLSHSAPPNAQGTQSPSRPLPTPSGPPSAVGRPASVVPYTNQMVPPPPPTPTPGPPPLQHQPNPPVLQGFQPPSTPQPSYPVPASSFSHLPPPPPPPGHYVPPPPLPPGMSNGTSNPLPSPPGAQPGYQPVPPPPPPQSYPQIPRPPSAYPIPGPPPPLLSGMSLHSTVPMANSQMYNAPPRPPSQMLVWGPPVPPPPPPPMQQWSRS